MSTIELSRFQHASDRRVQRTIAAIHDAFLSLAKETDLEKITVAAISDRANINRKTFYLHYNSIEDLFDEILYDEVIHLSDVINAECFDKNGALDVNKMFTLTSCEMVRSLNERGDIYRHVNSKWLIDHLEPIMTEQIVSNDSFQISESMGPYLKYCVTFFCSGLISVYKRWLDDQSELPMEELAVILSSAVEGGLISIVQLRGKQVTRA